MGWALLAFLGISPLLAGSASVEGRVADLQDKAVAGATVRLIAIDKQNQREIKTDSQGRFRIDALDSGDYELRADASGFRSTAQAIALTQDHTDTVELRFSELARQRDSIVITAKSVEPGIDLRNSEVFSRTLLTRDDQVFQQLNAGIAAGQHEGGGKSLEIRRFGFNLDHGGVNGGMKVLVDDVQQNQGTQGHGQGYLGSLKEISPELIQDVTIVNGPFSAEYGDFSGLGVVHIRQRESLPDQYTLRLQGGNFDTARGFVGFSPDATRVDSYLAYEGSYSNGPFQNPLRYRRNNVNGNFTRNLSDSEKIGVRVLFGNNDFYSSGQIPLDLVARGTLDRFGYVDPTDGGRIKLGTASAYYSKDFAGGDTFKVDGFISRSLFDLYSNFTYFLNDPINGDAFQQHDSRLQEGLNSQYIHNHKIGSATGLLTGGANFHDNQINVALYPRDSRDPTGVTTRANAHVTNAAGYAQESLSLFHNRLILGGGLRYDEFRYDVADRVKPNQSGVQYAGRWQGKGTVAYRPLRKFSVTFHANYGRGINSIDARGVVQHPEEQRLATTDFYQLGAASNLGRVSLSADVLLIDHSNEQSILRMTAALNSRARAGHTATKPKPPLRLRGIFL
jgi:hypothetical protein